MSGCRDFTQTNPNCRTVTLIEPDDTLLSATSTGSTDQSLDESGSTVIPLNVGLLQVTFATLKASTDYRFEYLYVDAFGITNPGNVEPVVVLQTLQGFTVDLAGIPLAAGYILRWRVVVVTITGGNNIDAPESLRLQLTQGLDVFTVTFINPRSTTTYGFTELRVENLIDAIGVQSFILAQVTAKTQVGFTVGLSSPPPTANYFLVVRTP